MYCRKCGTKNEADDKFCTGCGAALQKDTYIASEAKKSKKTNVKLFAGIGIAILLIACIIAAILIFPEKRREKQFNDLVVCAERYFEELNYEKAEAAYLEAISIDPMQESPYLRLAEMYMQQEKWENAKDILQTGYEQTGNEELQKKYREYVDIIEQQEAKRMIEEANALLEDFIAENGFLQYTGNWYFGVKGYSRLDINQDGIYELLVAEDADVEGEYQVYAVIENEVKLIREFSAFYGVCYSKEYQSLAYSEARLSSAYAVYEYEGFDGTQMIENFSIYSYYEYGTNYEVTDVISGKREGGNDEYFSVEEFDAYIEEMELIDDWTLIEYQTQTEFVEVRDYLTDDTVRNIAEAIGDMGITSTAEYKECAMGNRVTIGILQDSEDVYNQITDVINNGNPYVTIYGVRIGDTMEDIRDKILIADAIDREDGSKELLLGAGFTLTVKFEDDELSYFAYRVRYTS